MAGLSIEDKTKGKRIITQFFRTMPGVQKGLTTIFEREGYKGVHRLQTVLYPENASEIDSIDTLRKALSMILQHIYGMPVEDKEAYFQEILKCKTPSQVVRKEKETLISYFFAEFPVLKEYFSHELIEDIDYSFMNYLCQKYFGDTTEEISDMRGFKNQIRNLQEVLADKVNAGTAEDALKKELEGQKEEFQKEKEAQASAPAGGVELSGEAGEKQKIIVSTLHEDKYQGLRDFLVQKTATEPNFATFQNYLDNILDPSARIVAKDMATFTEGLKKIKEFRDNLEREIAS